MEKILPGVKNIYLVGIGGVGMSGLALLLKKKGFNVQGSDTKNSPNVKMLESEGIEVFIGHKAKHINSNINLLGYSSAVGRDNSEILQAKKLGINILKRGQLLAKLCQGRKTVAVAGSHGKTTTTSLLGYLLTSLGYNPAIFLGGSPRDYSPQACWGDDYFIIETDESDGSFLYCHPWVSIITNIDFEHLDYYKTIDNLRRSFLQFARQTKNKVFGCGDYPFVLDVISKVDGISFGWSKHNNVRGSNFRFDGNYSYFDLHIKDKFIVTAKVPLLGEYNCLNVLAVFAFFNYFGEDLKKVNQALAFFKGIKRRFQITATVNGVTFVDDYAHHPTEIKAVLKAAKLLKPKRIFVIVQPHRFSRLKLLLTEFAECFSEADKVVVTDIYSADEENPGTISAERFCRKAAKKNTGNIEYIPKSSLHKLIPPLVKEGDIVLALGAGDINILAEGIIDEFKQNRNQAQC